MEIQKITTLRIRNIFETGHKIRLNTIGKVIDPMIHINSDCQLEDQFNEYISDRFESEEWAWWNMRLTIGDYTIKDGAYMRAKGFQFYIKLYNAVRDGLLKHLPLLSNALLDLNMEMRRALDEELDEEQHSKILDEVDKFNEDVHNYCMGLIDHMLDFDLVDEVVEVTAT